MISLFLAAVCLEVYKMMLLLVQNNGVRRWRSEYESYLERSSHR